MTNNNKFIELPKTYTQFIVEDKVKLPTIEEIRERQERGLPALTEEEKDYLINGRQFNQVVIAYPAQEKKWKEEESLYKGDVWKIGNGEMSTRAKTWGVCSAQGELSYSAFKCGDDDEVKFEFLKPSIRLGTDLHSGNIIGINASFDLANVSLGVANARLGPNLDTEVSLGKDGVKLKVAGSGFKASDEGIELSTPIGSLSCVIQ